MDEQTKKAIVDLFLQIYKISFKPDLDALRDELKGELREFKEGAYSKLDSFVGEQKKIRDEQEVMNQRLGDMEAIPTLADELKKARAAV
jgi:hypothetical protein